MLLTATSCRAYECGACEITSHNRVNTRTSFTCLPAQLRSVSRPARGPRLARNFLPGSAVCAAQEQLVMEPGAVTPFDPDRNWQHVFGKWPVGVWQGYKGVWSRFTGSSDPDLKPAFQYFGLREFRNNGDDSFDQFNIYSQSPFRNVPQRPQDGYYQQEWSWTKDSACTPEGWHHPFSTRDGPSRGRCLAWSESRLSSMSFGLPLKDRTSSGGGSLPGAPIFGGEMFQRSEDYERRWSGGPLFKGEDGTLMGILFIREYRYESPGPEVAVEWDEEGMPREREPLPASPTDWLPAGCQGTREEFRWDAERNILQLAPRPVPYDPQEREGYRVVRLPDLFYTRFRETMPTTTAEMPADGVFIEFGGFTEEDTFRRTRISYNQEGNISSVFYDTFVKS